VIAVANREMTIYAGGVEATLIWRDEAEYRLARKFLTDRGALIAPSTDGRKKEEEYIYLENKGVIEALLNYMRPHSRR
jgi:hypothetical protein